MRSTSRLSTRAVTLGLFLAAGSARAQSILTVAGGGTDDGRQATRITLRTPVTTSVDAAGNLYIADELDQRVRKVDARTSIVRTVAGIGAADFSGDGGAATAAALNGPIGLDVDAKGNLYIADTSNYRIRRVDATSGTVATLAASLFGLRDLELDAAGSIVYTITLSSTPGILRLDPRTGTSTRVAGGVPRGFSGDGGPATQAALDWSFGLALDGRGNVFIADTYNNRVRRVDVATGIITTVAGSGPEGTLFGSFGGDGGPATAAKLYGPTDVAVDAAGNLYIADSLNRRIRRVDAQTGGITTVAGGGTEQGDGVPASRASLGIVASVGFEAPATC